MKLRLKYWRKRRALSQVELAEKAGLSEVTVNHIENGKIEPYPSTIRKLAEALNVTLDELMEEEDSRDLQKVG